MQIHHQAKNINNKKSEHLKCVFGIMEALSVLNRLVCVKSTTWMVGVRSNTICHCCCSSKWHGTMEKRQNLLNRRTNHRTYRRCMSIETEKLTLRPLVKQRTKCIKIATHAITAQSHCGVQSESKVCRMQSNMMTFSRFSSFFLTLVLCLSIRIYVCAELEAGSNAPTAMLNDKREQRRTALCLAA